MGSAYNALNMEQAGVVLQRARLAIFMMPFPMWIFFVSAGFIIKESWPNDEVADQAFDYIVWTFPSIMMMGLLDVQRKFLAQVERSNLALKILVPSLLLHVLWNYVFVWYLNLGIMGTAIAMFITEFTSFLGLYFVTGREENLKECLEVSIMDP